ncbi:hypothetical protein [Psychrobacillus sp. NPDC096623]|uniref:hypothetical protein n=1 Tax=Psychrobacillus sp. NPDC096623 TaxID=3364492 RepID=UPI00382E660D
MKKYFTNVLYTNKNRNIGLHLTNNRFVEGILLDVKRNHIVLEINEDIVYLAIDQIQALSKNTTDLGLAMKPIPHLVREDLTDVLIALRYHWVTLNNYSNHSFFGVLSCIHEDYIILIHNKELLYVPISHITDISGEITINDYTFLNKKEQRTIQQLYRSGLRKETFEIQDENLIHEQEKYTPADIKIIGDITELINNNEEVAQKESSSILYAKDNLSISEIAEPKKDVLEENAFAPQFEEELEIYPAEILNHLDEEQHIAHSDNQLVLSTNPLKVKEKSVLLTAWSTMNSDQSTVAQQKETNSIRKTTTQTRSFSNQLIESSNSEDKQETSNKISQVSEKKKIK